MLFWRNSPILSSGIQVLVLAVYLCTHSSYNTCPDRPPSHRCYEPERNECDGGNNFTNAVRAVFWPLQERTNLNLDFRRILVIWQTFQEACEVAEEDKMKDALFNFVIQVLNNACPVSMKQGH
jgi:hypothetical protein